MGQAVLIYVGCACHVLLICWFGTQLTQHVSMNRLLLLFSLQRHVDNAESFKQTRNSEIPSFVDPCL